MDISRKEKGRETHNWKKKNTFQQEAQLNWTKLIN